MIGGKNKMTKIMNAVQFLEAHKKYLDGKNKLKPKGGSANLRSANLSSANLRFADLSSADLSSANLSFANLRFADLSSADLSSADLSSANLRFANLRSADLSSADLSSADLSFANLRSADLSFANLDFTCFDLSCKTFGIKCDDRLLSQLICHIVRLDNNSDMAKDVRKLLDKYKNTFCNYREDIEKI
jgi:hypothetical protein